MAKHMDMDIDPEKRRFLAFLTICFLGGAAHQLHDWLGGTRGLTWKHFVARAVISTFIGVVCFYVFPKDSALSYGMSGLLSWLGAGGISLLIEIVLKFKEKKGNNK